MINFAAINKALKNQLESDADLIAMKTTVERGVYKNENYDLCPWLGVYRTDVIYEPRSMGRHSGSWLADLTARVVAQASSLESETAVEDALEVLVDKTIRAIWADQTIGGNVLTIVGFKVEYSYKESESPSMWIQEAMITINMQKKAGI